MTRTLAAAALALALVAGCSSSDDDAADSTTTSAAAPTTTTVPDLSVPAAGTGTIIMVKLGVDDADEAVDFYNQVFGSELAYDLGENAKVVTFPDGPGLILLEGAPGDQAGHGSFLIQVRDLEATKALALEQGATEEGTFEGNPGGEAARSVDLRDPWGNGIEVLQRG